jgi:hypothetical protein
VCTRRVLRSRGKNKGEHNISSSRVEEEEGLNDEGAEQIGAKDKESNTGGADLQPNARNAQDRSRDLRAKSGTALSENSLRRLRVIWMLFVKRCPI